MSNESHYELTTIYIGNILTDSWAGFWTDDSGYMPFFLKTICLILVKGMHIIRYAPIILSVMTIIIISLVIAFITSRRFRDVADMKDRYLFALILGCTQLMIVQSQMILPINVAYFGGILAAYIYMLDLEKQNGGGLILWKILSGLLIMSKGAFIVLIPVLLAVFMITIIKKYKRTGIYTVYLLLMLFFQCAYVLFGPGEKIAKQLSLKGIIRSIWVYLAASEKWIFRIDINTDTIALLVIIFIAHLLILGYAAGKNVWEYSLFPHKPYLLGRY